MNAEKELLNFVYQNSEMGVISIEKIEKVTPDPVFSEELRREKSRYLAVNAAAKSALNRLGCDEKGLGALSKIRTYLMIGSETLTDKSTPHLAQMMFLGNNMGVADAKKNLRKYQEVQSGEAFDLMHALCDLEEENARKMKSFL